MGDGKVVEGDEDDEEEEGEEEKVEVGESVLELFWMGTPSLWPSFWWFAPDGEFGADNEVIAGEVVDL